MSRRWVRCGQPEARTFLVKAEKRPPDLAFLASLGSALLAVFRAFFCTVLAADFAFCVIQQDAVLTDRQHQTAQRTKVVHAHQRHQGENM